MGVLCQSCNSLIIDLEQKNTNNKNKLEDILLPKDYIENTPLDEKKTEKDISVKIDDIDEEKKEKEKEDDYFKKKRHSAYVKNNNENDIEIKKDYLKAKSMVIERSSKKCHSVKLILEDKKK